LIDLGHRYKVWPIQFLPDGRIVGDTFDEEFGELRAYDLEDGSFERVLGEGIGGNYAFSRDGHFVINQQSEGPQTKGEGVISVEAGRWIRTDLEDGTTREFPEVGDVIWPYAFDPNGRFLVVPSRGGAIRVSYGDGKVHLLLGHKHTVNRLAVDPKGRWIASSSGSETEIRLWPIPEGVPFHTLPHEQFLERLRALTNVRVVPDPSAPNGYRIEYAEFPGWEEVPVW
jgi:WD40 repeat protein